MDLPQLVQSHFPGSTLLGAAPVPGGSSAHTLLLELRSPAGQIRQLLLRQPSEAVLRENPRAALDEFRVLRAVHALGLPVPQPYLYDPGLSVLLMEYVDGAPDFAPADTPAAAAQMAAVLARLHAVDVTRSGLSFLPAFSAAAEINRRPPAPDDSLQENLVRQVLALRASFPRRNSPVLLHGDYWPGNILWQNGRLAAVVDWEDAALGDPLADLAVARLDLLWIYGRQAAQAFTARYLALSPLDLTALPCWDLFAVLRLARLAGGDLTAWAAFFHPFGRLDITPESIRAACREFVDQALANLPNV